MKISTHHLKSASYLPALWIAALPFGPSVSSIFFILALLSFFINPPQWETLLTQMKQPWFIALGVLCLWTLTSLSFSPEFNHDSATNLKKVFRFLLIPLLMQSFMDKKHQDIAINGFIIGMLITVVLSIIKLSFHLNWYHDHDPGHLFYNHINTGFLCVFAAFCSLEYFFRVRRYKYAYLLSFFLLSVEILLINPGRAAYILYVAFLMLLIWLKSNNKLRWVYLAITPLVFMILIKFSHVLQTRLQDFYNDIEALNQGIQSTSIGYRLQFYHFSYLLFQKHILIGNGPGSFCYYFKLLNPVPDWSGPPNPHSQYWLILVEEGLIGLGLWLIFFYQLWKKMEIIGQVFILLIAINSFSDAILYSCPGQLFLGIAALSLSKGRKE